MTVSLEATYLKLLPWQHVTRYLDDVTVLLVLSGKLIPCFYTEKNPQGIIIHGMQERISPFKSSPCAVLLPPGGLEISVADLPGEGLLVSLGHSKLSLYPITLPFVVPAAQFRQRHIDYGEGTQRTVWTPELPMSWPIRFGETVNEVGCFSSFPAHQNELDLLAQYPDTPGWVERFFVVLDPPAGWGLIRRQGRWAGGGQVDDAQVFQSGQWIEVPCGFHPITAGPNMRLYYAWFYFAGEGKGKEYGEFSTQTPYL